MTRELTKDEAIALVESEWWVDKTDDEIVRFQLFTKRLCMPFGRFHEAVEKALKRPVWTHEFTNFEALQKEYLGERRAPTFEEIMDLIPAEKRAMVGL